MKSLLHPEKPKSEHFIKHGWPGSPEQAEAMLTCFIESMPRPATNKEVEYWKEYDALECGMHVEIMSNGEIQTGVIYGKIGAGCYCPILLDVPTGKVRRFWVEVKDILKAWHPDNISPCQPT